MGRSGEPRRIEVLTMGLLAREQCCGGVEGWEWKDIYGRTRTVSGALRNGNAAGRWEGVVCSWRDFEKRSKGDEVLGKKASR